MSLHFAGCSQQLSIGPTPFYIVLMTMNCSDVVELLIIPRRHFGGILNLTLTPETEERGGGNLPNVGFCEISVSEEYDSCFLGYCH